MFSLCDVIIGNYSGEFSFFTDETEMETGCMELGRDRIIICHNGTDPIFVADHGRAFTVPVNPVVVRHTIGAGDVFNAGILHGFASGMNCEEAVREGALQARNYLIRECL
jgi:sugar/nucleoside kinase (ribokinase family)